MEVGRRASIVLGDGKHVGGQLWAEHGLRLVEEPESLVARIEHGGGDLKVTDILDGVGGRGRNGQRECGCDRSRE